jgi:hypothetical protein
MFTHLEKAIFEIAMLRIFSGSIEIIAAVLIIKVNQIDKALIINSSLAIIGPLVLIITTSIGVLSITDNISYGKIVWIFIGIACIFYGVKGN